LGEIDKRQLIFSVYPAARDVESGAFLEGGAFGDFAHKAVGKAKREK
jgi:hypothetical protein